MRFSGCLFARQACIFISRSILFTSLCRSRQSAAVLFFKSLSRTWSSFPRNRERRTYTVSAPARAAFRSCWASFAPKLDRNQKKLLKLLSRIRKRAGKVRDLDVQLAALRSVKIPQRTAAQDTAGQPSDRTASTAGKEAEKGGRRRQCSRDSQATETRREKLQPGSGPRSLGGCQRDARED